MINKMTWRQILAIISFVGLIVIIYYQVVHFNFANIDDSVYVTQNSHVLGGLSLENIKWAFTSTYAGFWHPLTWLSLMLDAQIYGSWAGGYHLTNLLLHIASSLILLMFFYRTTGAFWRSLFVSVLFALHPLHVESVVWIGERKDVLSVFWWMLTIYAYAYYTEDQGLKRYLLVVISFFFGLMSKPMLVTLPFILILLDYWPLCRISFPLNSTVVMPTDKKNITTAQTNSMRGVILEKIPLFVIIIPISIVTFLAENKFGALPSTEAFPFDVRFYNAIISYGRYIVKTILPINLSIYYPHPGMWPMWQIIFAGTVIIALSSWVMYKMFRYRYLALGWFWYLGTLVPVIGLIQVGPSSMADRYSYIPIIGLFIMMAWGVPDLVRRLPHQKVLLFSGAVLLIVVFSILSWQRCKLWGDNYLLWDNVLKQYSFSSTSNVKKNYQIAFAYNFRGLGYAEKGDYAKAIADYNLALKINVKYMEALNNRANVYESMGRNDLAFIDFAQAININPKFATAYYNRGILYLKTNQPDKAVVDFTSAIEIVPDMADYYNNRGVAYRMQGQYEKAVADFNKALSINSNIAEAYCNRGIIYNLYGQYFPAVVNFTEALSIKPSYVDARFHRGIAFASLGKYDQAMKDFSNVLGVVPNHTNALKNLGMVLKLMHRYEESSEQYKKVLRMKPDDQEVLKQLSEIEKIKKNKSSDKSGD